MLRTAALALAALATLTACNKASSPQATRSAHTGSARLGTAGGGGSVANRAEASGAMAQEEADDATVATAPRPDRPALGTRFGESRRSEVRTVSFERASNRPDTVLSVRYNDTQTVRALAVDQRHFEFLGASDESRDGRLRLLVQDAHGELLPGVDIGAHRYAIAQAGQHYTLGIENDSDSRFEVVASVDGLDVMDGQPASFEHRGYLVDPFTSITIEGWRTSEAEVAAFQFSETGDSYADRTGQGRNLGVIGAAFFAEDRRSRRGGDPFPARFAPPPPPRRQSDGWF